MFLIKTGIGSDAEAGRFFSTTILISGRRSLPAPLSPAERTPELVPECGSCGETVTLLIAVPFSLESPNAQAIYVRACVVKLSEIPEQKIFRCGVAFLPVAGHGPTPEENQPAAWAAFLASAES